MPGAITITRGDRERLLKFINERRYSDMRADPSLLALESEIGRAQVVDSQQLPPDVVTMHSRALVRLNGETMEVTLVYPHEADWTQKKLSVLSPVGMALLGYREGDRIEWDVPSGRAAIEIQKVLYQPEAAGDFHL